MSGPVSRRCPLIFSLSIWKSCIIVFLLFAQLDKEQKGIQTNLRLSLSPPTVRGELFALFEMEQAFEIKIIAGCFSGLVLTVDYLSV